MEHASIEPVLESRGFLEHYELREAIATGGFGHVYRARQRTTGQDVAVKVLPFSASERQDLARFRQELAVCASLHHPNIVRLIDSGDTGAASRHAIFAVFELIPGSTLADVIGAEGALDPSEALHLMGQVLDALACAHAAGVVHRDLNPSNVMLTATGARRNALVLDFGLGTFYERVLAQDTRMTERGTFVGTPAYAAPEQLRGEGAQPNSDLFAWGLLLLECLTGHPVLEGPLAQIIHLQLGPKRIPIPDALADHPLGRLIASVVAKDPARRAARAVDLLRDLARIASTRLPPRNRISGLLDAQARASETPSFAERSDRLLVPLHRNPNFTGRETLLSRVRTELRRVGGSPVVALRGAGGMGKSQLALEYTYRYGDDYDLVAWLRAEKPETLAEDHAALAQTLGLPEGTGPDQRERIEAVRSWLERYSGWLLVFDNAQNPDAIRRFLPRVSLGHVLVTSRHPSWRSLGVSLEVEELALDEAVSFLLRRTDQADRGAAERLAESVGRLPLALEEAAAYIEATGRSLHGYVDLLEEQQRSLARGSSLPGLTQSLLGTWELSLRQIEEELPEAADLLRLLAFLAPDDIPLSLLRNDADALPAALRAAAHDPLRFDACVAALRRFSLIKVQGESASLHRMIQLATRSRLDPSTRDAWAQRALRLVESSFPSGLAGNFYHPEARPLLPHALAVLSHGGALGSERMGAGRLRRRAGLYLRALGAQREAAEYLERALADFESGGSAADNEVANTLAGLGIVLYGIGDLEGATARGERALAIHERLHGPADLRVAIDHMDLAWVLRSRGRFEEVREHSLRAREIAVAVLGDKHPLAAMPLGSLSRACWGLGDIEGARRAAEQAIEVLERGDVHHPLVCACWQGVAQVTFDLGQTEIAGRCAETAIEIAERAWGPHHILVAVSRVVRGMVELRRGDLESARDLLSSAILAGEKTSHWQHEETAMARCLLARVQRRLGDSDAALGLEQARATLSRVCGERTRSASQVEIEYGLMAFDDRDFASAAERAETALRLLTGYRNPHPYQLPALDLLASALEAIGKRDAAREVAKRAVGIAGSVLESIHPDLTAARRILAIS
jgi:serine/threonine protein kinase/tetratricopeptide (TPR) repeat protein